MAERAEIPKSKGPLQRPVDQRHALLRVEGKNAWIRSLDRGLAEMFCTLVTRGDRVTAARSVGVVSWGIYAGEPDQTGTIILDRKSDGRFKLVPLDDTANGLLEQVAQLVGREGSVTSGEGKHGPVFRGELRDPDGSIQTKATAQEAESEVAVAEEETLARKVKIPRSRGPLQRPVDQRHALLRVEGENAWIRSLDRELAETFCALVTRGNRVTGARTAGVVSWGIYAGQPDQTGTVILDRKSDGRFKLVPLDDTANRLLEEVAHLVGREGSVTSGEGKHGLIWRGELRHPDEAAHTAATGEEAEAEVGRGSETTAGKFETITGEDAIAAIGQKVIMEFIERGIKVRIRGKQADCEKTAKRILKGSPTVASQQGAKYMIEGNLSKSFLRKGANQEGPDAHGVCTREDGAERSFTAFGENLPAVQAACLTGCKEETMFTIVVNDRSAGYVVISSGRRRLV